MHIEIKSKNNINFRLLKKLTSLKGRRDYMMFLAEGKRFVNYNPEYIFCLKGREKNLLNKRVFVLDKELFDTISELENSEGYISVFKIYKYDLKDLSDNVILLDRVQNPDNLGAIVRNMNAFGLKDIALVKGSCDPFSPKSVRASMGSIMDIRVFYIDASDIKKVFEEYNLIATDCNEGLPPNEIDMVNKNVLIFGNESRGISKDILSFAKQKLNIPINKKVDSLNVAVASGIAIYSLFS